MFLFWGLGFLHVVDGVCGSCVLNKAKRDVVGPPVLSMSPFRSLVVAAHGDVLSVSPPFPFGFGFTHELP